MECVLGKTIIEENIEEEFVADQTDRDDQGKIRHKCGCYKCYQLLKKNDQIDVNV